MKKTRIIESPIDAARLIKALHETYCANRKQTPVDLIIYVNECKHALKTNVQKGLVRDFLTQLKPVFQADGDVQHQLLITQFIKDNLEQAEREIFMAHVAALSSRVISKRMKETIYKDLS